MRTASHLPFILSVLLAPALWGADAPDPEVLAKESTEACQASASTKPTSEMIIAKVNEAAALVEKEGKAAFAKFRGRSSPYIFAGTYIWIHDLDGVMLMHPIKPKMETKPLIGLKDAKGKLFFTVMNALVQEKGSGWVDYWWPKPGETQPALKVSYVKLAKHGGESFVLGCGVYDLDQTEVDKLVGK